MKLVSLGFLTSLALLSFGAGCAAEDAGDPAESSIAVTQSGSLPITPPGVENVDRVSQPTGLPILTREPTISEPVEGKPALERSAPVLPSRRP